MNPNLAYVLHFHVLQVDGPQVILGVRQRRRWRRVHEGRIREARDGWERGDRVGGRFARLEPQPGANRKSARPHAGRVEAAPQQAEEGDDDVGVIEGEAPLHRFIAAAHDEIFDVHSAGQPGVGAARNPDAGPKCRR